MLHILQTADDYPESLIGLYQEDRSPDPFLLRMGMPLLKSKAVAHLRFRRPAAEVSKRNLLLHNGAGVPLASPRLAALLLELCPADIQLLEARILAAGTSVSGYRLVNTLHQAAVVDRERSDVLLIPGSSAILKFRKLRFSRTDLDGHHLARVSEMGSMIVVSDVLREKMLKLGLSGWTFLRDEDIRP